jgi:hypothetical protein
MKDLNKKWNSRWFYSGNLLPPLETHSTKAPRVNDEDILAMHATSSPKDTNQGPLTRSRAKKLQEQVNLFLTNYNFNTSKNVILPKCPILMMLRFTHEDVEGTWPKDQDTVLQNSYVKKVTRADDRTQRKVMQIESNMDGQSDPGKSNADGK